MPTAWMAPASARARTAATASVSAATPLGPKVLGRVWSCPLSSVMSASVPAPPGSVTSCTGVRVTTSSGRAGVVVALVTVVVVVMAQAFVVAVAAVSAVPSVSVP